MPLLAVPALAAADPGIDHGLVADLGALGVGADGHHLAHDLVAHGARRIHGLCGRVLVAAAHVEEAFPQMDVAVADAGGGDAHQHLGALRGGIGFLDLLQRLAEFDDLVAFHCTHSRVFAADHRTKPPHRPTVTNG